MKAGEPWLNPYLLVSIPLYFQQIYCRCGEYLRGTSGPRFESGSSRIGIILPETDPDRDRHPGPAYPGLDLYLFLPDVKFQFTVYNAEN
jgi:hypothetical protein